jgi:hypothetical protein
MQPSLHLHLHSDGLVHVHVAAEIKIHKMGIAKGERVRRLLEHMHEKLHNWDMSEHKANFTAYIH